MDKNRDAAGQVNSKQELHREMQRTRQSMSETLGDIEGEISYALDWQTYVRRHPGACLIGSGAVGFIIGRAIQGSGQSRNVKNLHHAGEVFDGARTRSRMFSSKDSSVRRVIDMAALALLAEVAPIVSSKLKDLLGIHAGERGGQAEELTQLDTRGEPA
jgi:hypothetical protein